MSTTEDAPAAVAPAAVTGDSGVADPAPLGLAAFALTTFLLSAINAGWAKTSTGGDWWGYAIAYGGLIQLLAGMWEFRNKNVFGATAFSTYGGFWIGVGLWLHFIAPTAGSNPVALNRDLGWILLVASFRAWRSDQGPVVLALLAIVVVGALAVYFRFDTVLQRRREQRAVQVQEEYERLADSPSAGGFPVPALDLPHYRGTNRKEVPSA